MKITNLTIRSAMKVSRDYNTVDSDITLSAELSRDDNVEEVHKELTEMAHAMVLTDVESSLDNLASIV